MTAEEIAELREEIRRVQQMSPAIRFFAGAELFDLACKMTLAGIQWRFPEMSAEEHAAILKERVNRDRHEFEKAAG